MALLTLIGSALLLTLSGSAQEGASALRLDFPNGQALREGDSVTIEWSGIDAADTVILEFSADNGISWQSISDNATGLQHRWRVTGSASSAMFKVTQRSVGGRALFDSLPFYSVKTRGLVRDVQLAPDGKRAYVILNDGRLEVWSVADSVRVAVNDTLQARFVAVAPSSSLYAVVPTSTSGLTALWNASTNTFNRRLSTGQAVGRVAFINDSTVANAVPRAVWVVRLSRNGASLTETILATLNGPTGNVVDVSFAPQNRIVVAGSTDSTVRLWSGQSGVQTLVRRMDSPVRSVSTNSNATLVAYSLQSGRAEVSRDNAGPPLFTIDQLGATQVRIVEPLNIVLCGKTDGQAVLVHANRGLTMGVLRGHMSSVRSVSSDSAGRILATGSEDSTVRFWFVQATGSDLSDTPSVIRRPLIAARPTIDFGEVEVGDTARLTLQRLIRSTGDTTAIVENIEIQGPERQLFAVSPSGSLDSSLAPGEGIDLNLSFFPPDSGSYGADLIVLTATQRLVVRLTGQGKRPSVVFDTLIDLGQQIPGVRKDTIVRGIIRYFGNGSRRLEVNTRDSVIGLGSLPTAARLPLTIGSRDSASIAFRFTPQGAREYLDSLEVRDTSQAIVARIPVRGRGVCPALLANPIATSPAPQLVEYLPGDSLRIPIRLLTNIPAGVNIPFRVELRTDASVLWFNPEQYNLLPEGVSQRLIVEGQTGSPDTTLVLNAIVTLGRTDTIAIELLSLGFAQCELAQQSGAAISAVAICKAGGRRLFEPGLAAAMTSIRYVEAAQTVLVDGQLSESGSVQVALYDLMGRTQAQCTFEARPGVFRAELPTEPLSHGLYVVTMRTTTRVISGTLLR